ncbi:hypothetical protein VNO77_20848 [Canavalia gladiata]|uniref:Uncharacterized protein n=1 Tax=Canavalia gladiata TaxID=3824 RepID=A0AAN9LQ97_CANGL
MPSCSTWNQIGIVYQEFSSIVLQQIHRINSCFVDIAKLDDGCLLSFDACWGKNGCKLIFHAARENLRLEVSGLRSSV